ncbi:MAG: MlaD family protein [Chitinophagaceae bacterium]
MRISKEIKLALLGIAAIAAFAFGYDFLKSSGVFSSNKTILAEYDNVENLTPASYVQLQGFNIGSVKSIALSKTHAGKVEVVMSIDKNIEIPNNSFAQIMSLDLLGTKAINIVKGNSNTYIKDGEFLEGSNTQDAISSLSNAATPLLDSVKSTLSMLDPQLNTTFTNINNILDHSTQVRLKHSIENLDNTMANLNQFANELNTQRNKISSLLDNLNNFTNNLSKNNTSINNILRNAETTTKNLSQLELQNTVTELKNTLGTMQTTLNKLNEGSGSMALLMNDDKLYKNLKNTLETANNLLYDLSAHPSKYVNINIIGRKNKKDTPPETAPNTND